MSANNIIEIENLVKRYKKADKNAIDGINLEVKEGEFFAFLGPNGAGKTSTISVLTTTLAKTSGKVTIAGYDLDKQNKEIRKNIGIIFQNASLDVNLTAEENVRLHVSLYGIYTFMPFFKMMPIEYRNRIEKLSEIVGLDKDLFKPIKSYSGGMKRKLEIIRSLMHKPKILFLDEPSSGLDPVSRRDLWTYLQKVREEENTTIFLTTHYLDEAEGADRVCVINHGKIIKLASTQELKEQLIDNYLILDADNKEELRNEISKLNLKFEENGFFKVYFNNQNLQTIINSFKTELSKLDIVKPTLEEAYINLIGSSKEEVEL